MGKEKDKVYGYIYVTKDYNKFKYIKGNRNINISNKNKLENSMSEKQLVTPILVNENFEVIDGQHRLTVCKEKGLPVYYHIEKGYDINDVKRANIVSRTWKMDDYLNMFVENGEEEYINFKEIVDAYGLTVKSLMVICATLNNKPLKEIEYKFKQGELEFDYNGVLEFLDSLDDFNFFDDYYSLKFISAFLEIYNKPTYNHKNMQNKINSNGYTLTKQHTKDDYLNILCNKIYSYALRKDTIRYDIVNKNFY